MASTCAGAATSCVIGGLVFDIGTNWISTNTTAPAATIHRMRRIISFRVKSSGARWEARVERRLSNGDGALRDLMMEIVEEVILPGIELRQLHGDGLAGLHHALAVKLEAFELDS